MEYILNEECYIIQRSSTRYLILIAAIEIYSGETPNDLVLKKNRCNSLANPGANIFFSSQKVTDLEGTVRLRYRLGLSSCQSVISRARLNVCAIRYQIFSTQSYDCENLLKHLRYSMRLLYDYTHVNQKNYYLVKRLCIC